MSVRRDHVLWRKEHEKSLDEVGRYSGFHVQPGSQDRARTNPISQRTGKGDLNNGSSKIELIAHLGHKVIVRGYVLPEGKEQPGEEAHKQNKTGKGETADFRVLTLKMISTTCTQ